MLGISLVVHLGVLEAKKQLLLLVLCYREEDPLEANVRVSNTSYKEAGSF
jgi:hypothetical protein